MESHDRELDPLPHYVPLGEPFQRLFGPCRSTQADLVNGGEIRSVLVGGNRGRRMIETASYLEYLDRQRKREAAGEIGGRSLGAALRKRRRDKTSTPKASPLSIERPQSNAQPRQEYQKE